jgi:hypothetical protein
LILQEHLAEARPEAFLAELLTFLSWVRGSFAIAAGLEGQALDAILTNATRDDSGHFHLFDLEWTAAEGVPVTWWILRNTLACNSMRGPGIAGIRTLAELYDRLCRELSEEPRLEVDIARELGFAAAVRAGEPGAREGDLRQALAAPWPTATAQNLDAAQLRATLALAADHQQLVAEYRRLETWALHVQREYDAVVADRRALAEHTRQVEAQLQRQESGLRS